MVVLWNENPGGALGVARVVSRPGTTPAGGRGSLFCHNSLSRTLKS